MKEELLAGDGGAGLRHAQGQLSLACGLSPRLGMRLGTKNADAGAEKGLQRM